MSVDMSQVKGIVRAEDSGAMPHPVHGYGSVVAFEGNADLISTQLRLLPISSKILILNSLLDAIPRFAAGSRFDAPSFVAHVHKVFAARAATARSFLEDSTEEHPRLVLMNGGSMSAKAACLEKICEKVTSGDLEKAEAVYEDIVRTCGLDNMVPAFISAYPELILSHQTSPIAMEFPAQHSQSAVAKTETNSQKPRSIMQNDGFFDRHETGGPELPYMKDPGFVAMRAASMLDRAAASLQSYQHFDFLSDDPNMATSRTSIDTSVWGLSRAGTVKTMSDAPSDVLSLMSRGRTLIRGTLRDRRMGRKRFSSLDSNLLSVELGRDSIDVSYSAISPTHVSLKHDSLGPLSSPDSRQRWTRYSEATTVSTQRDLNSLLRSGSNRDPRSIPPTPVILEFGEARLVSMASSKNLKRASSVDGIFTIPERPPSTTLASSAFLKHSYSTMCLHEEPTTMKKQPRSITPSSVADQPRKVVVKTSKKSLNKCMEAPLWEEEKDHGGMVDRGCSPVRFEVSEKNSRPLSPMQGHPPQVPAVEDLIIHVDDGHRNKILEAIMNGYRDNSNKINGQTLPKQNEGARPAPAAFSKSTAVTRRPFALAATITTDCRYSEQKPPPKPRHDAHGPRKGSTLAHSSSREKDYSLITSNATPPTPASTPPPVVESRVQVRKLSDFGILPPSPSAPSIDDNKASQLTRLEEFGIVSSGSLDTQNSLRSTLAKHFPSKDGYKQYPVKTEFPDRLWKPLFRTEHDGSSSDSVSRRTMDQILALGCDDFVDRSVWTNVLARVEGLGMLKDGSAVGKFDMQYLMTTAMETFTTLPLNHQSLHTSNPFTCPSKLAKLFVPHLERYLSSNPCVRFLIITFPSGSLSSMLALRHLLGTEAMKVAMLSNYPRSSTPVSSNPSSNSLNKLSNEATIALNSRKRVPLSRLGNSKAQALLGNEQVPKPLNLKKSSNLFSSHGQGGKSKSQDDLSADRPDFLLEVQGGQDYAAVETGVDDLVHKIRKVLIEKNSIYGSAIPISPHFAIANWSAATAPGGAHSPTSSTSSKGSRGRKLTKTGSMDTGASPATFGRSRAHELAGNGLPQTYSQMQRSSTALDARKTESRESRESGEWQNLYLSVGEGHDDFTLPAPSPAPQLSPLHFGSKPITPTPEDEADRSASRTSHLDSDSEEDESEEDGDGEMRMFLPRKGHGERGLMRAGLPVRRDIGKALRMLGIA